MNENDPTAKRKAKDRDGLYKRRDYWHYELIIDGKKRSFTTGTKDYNQAKKTRAAAVRELEQGRVPNDSGRKRFEAAADEYIKHRERTVAAGTVRLEKERLKPLKRIIGNVMLKGWRTAWRHLTKAAELPGFRFHDLRHTFITNHAEIGTPLPVVMAQAGHLSKRMTELYTHISNRPLEDAAARYEQKKAELLEAAKKKLEQEPAKRAPSPVN
jgi:integrase